MGNQLAQPQRVHQDHLADIPDIVFKESIGKAASYVCASQSDIARIDSDFSNFLFRRGTFSQDNTLRARQGGPSHR